MYAVVPYALASPLTNEMSESGENLIFLISQPRAGSTLLQRILAAHSQVHTTAETWIMLHPLYALRKNGLWAEYNASFAYDALCDFLQSMPDGREEYIKTMRLMYASLYQRALAGTGKRFFLDKTPRYYFIIPELSDLFPKAKFVILIRNPLAVFASVLRTWIMGNWELLPRQKYDLVDAPGLLLNGIDHLADKAITIHYEELVRMPEEVVRRLCAFLDLDFERGMLEYGRKDAPRGQMGDGVNIGRHAAAVPDYVDRWTEEFDSAQTRHFAENYLETLGPAVITRLGYSFEELKSKITSQKCSRKGRSIRVPWGLLMNLETRYTVWNRLKLKTLLYINKRA